MLFHSWRSKRHSLYWVRIKTGIRIHKSNSIPIEPPHKTQYLLHVGLCGKVIRYFGLYRLTILLGENMVNVERRWCFYGLFIHTCYCFWFFLSRSWRLCDGFHSPIHPTPHSKQIQVMCIHKHRCQSCRINELIYDV